MGTEFIKNLSGHSGCNIGLYFKDGMFFVRKFSGNIGYNRRLLQQMLKQASYPDNGVMRAPRVYARHIDSDGLFYFDMEYVRARTLAEFMSYISISDISKYIKILFDSLPLSDGRIHPTASDIFTNKISSLQQTFSEITPVERVAFDVLNRFDFSQIPNTRCHGDLTLENILVTPSDELYLIDFLDSFYNSWMIDVAKLLQDLELHWSYRNTEISANLSIRLLAAKNALLENILALDSGRDKLDQIEHILLLNVLRIVPYAKDEKTTKFLQTALQQTLNLIQNQEIK